VGRVQDRFNEIVAFGRDAGLRIPEWRGPSVEEAAAVLEERFGFEVHEHAVDWYAVTAGSHGVAESFLCELGDGYVFDPAPTAPHLIDAQDVFLEGLGMALETVPAALRAQLTDLVLPLATDYGEWLFLCELEAGTPPVVAFYNELHVNDLTIYHVKNGDGEMSPCTLPDLLEERLQAIAEGLVYVDLSQSTRNFTVDRDRMSSSHHFYPHKAS